MEWDVSDFYKSYLTYKWIKCKASGSIFRHGVTLIRFILWLNMPSLNWRLLDWKHSSDLCKKAFFAPKIEKPYSPNPRLKRTGYKKGGGGTENSTALSPGNNGQRRQVDTKNGLFLFERNRSGMRKKRRQAPLPNKTAHSRQTCFCLQPPQGAWCSCLFKKVKIWGFGQ